MGLNPQVLAIVQLEGGRGCCGRRPPPVLTSHRTVAERRRRTAEAEERQVAGFLLPAGWNATGETGRRALEPICRAIDLDRNGCCRAEDGMRKRDGFGSPGFVDWFVASCLASPITGVGRLKKSCTFHIQCSSNLGQLHPVVRWCGKDGRNKEELEVFTARYQPSEERGMEKKSRVIQ